MARRKGQRSGWLRIDKGTWLLTYRVYTPGQKKPQRVTQSIGPAEGPGKLSEKQAERFAWDHYLSPLDETILRPQSTMTVDQYWAKTYEPWLRAFRKKTTVSQYVSLYGTYIKPAFGTEHFQDLTPDAIEGLVTHVVANGGSSATANHVRKVVGALFAKAKKSKVAAGENPAWESERAPAKPKRKRTSLNPDQFRALLDLLPSFRTRWSQPYREMAMMAALTSMNAAEFTAVRWQALNLNDTSAICDGETLPPRSVGVFEHWKLGEYTSLKTVNRHRIIPLPDELCRTLAELKAASECTKPHQPVFSSREGTPIDADNVRARYLKPAAESLGLVSVGWHSFRRTNATSTNDAKMDAHDRRQILGHGSMDMVDHYTDANFERARAGLQQVERALAPIKTRVI